MVLAVAEPTLSGLHDFERVAQLAKKLGIRGAIRGKGFKTTISGLMSCKAPQELLASSPGTLRIRTILFTISLRNHLAETAPVPQASDTRNVLIRETSRYCRLSCSRSLASHDGIDRHNWFHVSGGI